MKLWRDVHWQILCLKGIPPNHFVFGELGVSKNRGAPKSWILIFLIGFSIIFTIHYGAPLFWLEFGPCFAKISREKPGFWTLGKKEAKIPSFHVNAFLGSGPPSQDFRVTNEGLGWDTILKDVHLSKIYKFCTWKGTILKGTYIFQPSIFRHVSFQGGNPGGHWNPRWGVDPMHNSFRV